MNKIAEELDRRLKLLDTTTARQVEQLVSDALALARSTTNEDAKTTWPEGYFARTAGALTGESFDRSSQSASPTRGDW